MAATVLIIDDDPSLLALRADLLRTFDYRVVTANDGVEGLQLFQKAPLDLVVLDYYLPQLNGEAVAMEMKRLRPEVPIVLFSAYIDLPKSAFDHVDAYLVKCEPAEVFLHTVAQLVARSKTQAA